MLPTRLSPVTVDNQYIVSQTAAFSTICCVPDIPSDGVTNDITLETLMTGPCSSRVVRTAGTGYRPDEGPANAQRRQGREGVSGHGHTIRHAASIDRNRHRAHIRG